MCSAVSRHENIKKAFTARWINKSVLPRRLLSSMSKVNVANVIDKAKGRDGVEIRHKAQEKREEDTTRLTMVGSNLLDMQCTGTPHAHELI